MRYTLSFALFAFSFLMAAYAGDEYSVTFYIDGQPSVQKYQSGERVVVPTVPEEVEGFPFVGWTEEALVTASKECPALVEPATVMGSENLTYYAVFAQLPGEEVRYVRNETNAFDREAQYVLVAEESATDGTLHYLSSYKGTTANEDWGLTSIHPEDAILFTLSGTAKALKAKDADGNYIQALSVRKFRMQSYSTSVAYREDGTIGNPESGATGFNLRYNHNGGGGGFRWYNSSTGTPAYFYLVERVRRYSAYATSIHHLQSFLLGLTKISHQSPSHIHNLRGQKIPALQRGVNIIGERKVLR